MNNRDANCSTRYFNPSKNYWFTSFNAFLISLYFRCLSFRVVLVNTARPDGAFLFVDWFIHWKRMIRPFLFIDKQKQKLSIQEIVVDFWLTSVTMGFFFRSFFFRTTRELEHLFYLSSKARNFFQYLTLDYMTKTLNHIFFSSTKIRIFFQQHWESEYFFFVSSHYCTSSMSVLIITQILCQFSLLHKFYVSSHYTQVLCIMRTNI